MKRNKLALKSETHKQMTIPVFIPHLGCGHACTFCNQRTISGVERETEWSELQIRTHIDEWLSSGENHQQIEIGFFGGSFTGIPAALQERYLSIAKSYYDLGKINGIRLSTRPDYIDEEVVKRLNFYGVTLVELGVQSFSNVVLAACRRGHDSSVIDQAVTLLKGANIAVGIQLMLGLPQDTPESFMDSVNKTIALRPACVRLYPTLVLADTELAVELNQGHYQPLELTQAVLLAAEAYQLFRKAEIPVIRMGLQSSENLSEGVNVLAGPHHDAFRTLVESEIFKRLMERDLENGLPDTRLSVRVHPKHVSFFSGYKQSNLKWLEEQGIHIDQIIKDPAVALYQIIWITNHEGKR